MRRSVGLKVIALILVTAAAGVHVVEMDKKNYIADVSATQEEERRRKAQYCRKWKVLRRNRR